MVSSVLLIDRKWVAISVRYSIMIMQLVMMDVLIAGSFYSDIR